VINHGKPHKKLSHYQHNWVVTMGRNYHGYYLQWVVETIRNHFDAVYHIFFYIESDSSPASFVTTCYNSHILLL